MLRKEPAVIVAVLAAIAQAAVMFFTDNVEADTDWLMPILTLLAGLITRQNVFSENTVREAGMTPQELTDKAEDPRVQKAEGK